MSLLLLVALVLLIGWIFTRDDRVGLAALVVFVIWCLLRLGTVASVT